MYKNLNLMEQKGLVDELIEYKEVDQNIVKSFYLKEKLSPDIFNSVDKSYKMIDTVREKLLEASSAFIDYLGVDFFIYDVILTGSLANFNWSEYSDVDLHILMNFNEIVGDNTNTVKFAKILEEFFKSKKNNWNSTHTIKVKNYDIELYIQNETEQHLSSGVYSILNNKWIIEPVYGKKGIDEKLILSKGEEYATIIDDLIQKNEDGVDVIPEINDVKVKLKKFRQSGLEGGGEFSYENLTFKLLRRNGYIGKLIHLKRDIIDKKLSVTQ